MLTIVPVYAAILAVLFFALSIRIIALRRASKLPLGFQGDIALERRVRAQGNFAEYVPLALLLLAFVEMRGAPAWLLHVLALLLVAGRISHAYGVSQLRETFAFRVTGMGMTFTVILCAALAIFVQSFR
ncbi:MAPEG family protein [Pseudorhodoplanes sp.]|uniref:MAPEG family protein n=1 Tax=Pseudorhodoplanes sp. TaxID=1934341 RepID=UPI003919C728